MPSATTLRGELLKAVKTFNDRFFLTLGNTGAGMNPYNPIQVGIGARLIIQTDKNVNSVSLSMSRVVDGASVSPISLNPVKTSDSTWEVEGAIGGSRLGFPQPAPGYHVPQCFELRMIARNRAKVDEKIYTFWVGEGLVGTIASCIDRKVIGTKPLIAGYDGLGWHDFMFADNYAEFYARNTEETFVSNDDACLKGLTPDPLNEHVYVESGPDLWTELPYPLAPANPWIRLQEPSPDAGFTYPLMPVDTEYVINGVDQTGLLPAGSVFVFGAQVVAAALGKPISFQNGEAWAVTPKEPTTNPTFTWVVSPLLDFRYYQNSRLEFYLWEDVEFDGGIKLQYSQDEGATWTDFAGGAYSLPLVGGGPPMTVFGGPPDKIGVSAEVLTRVEVDLSAFDGQQVRVRWCCGYDGGVPVDAAGNIISGIKYMSDPGIALCIERNMDHLRAGYDAAWSYARIPAEEKWQHGTIQKARRLAPAAVHPTLGTGLVDNLVANPQLGDDIGGLPPPAPNIGYPRGLDGLRIELVSGENWGSTGSDDFVFDLVMDNWAPGAPGTLGYHILFGRAADWVGGANLGGFIELQVAQPAHLLCSIQPGLGYYDVPSGAVAWPAVNTIGATFGVAAPGTVRLTLRKSTSGVFFILGAIYAVQVIAHTPGALTIAGAGYFGRQFPVDTIRSNVLRLTSVV